MFIPGLHANGSQEKLGKNAYSGADVVMFGLSMRIGGMLGMALLVGACALTPRNGPDDITIQEKATARLDSDEATLGYDYVLVDVTKDRLPFITADTNDEFKTFGVSRQGAPELRLGVGDVVQVTVFESQAGGLFIPEEAGARPGNFVVLPSQEIGQNGQITVPYAGSIRAAGSTPAAVESVIRQRLAGRAIEPEVSLEILESNFPRVSVLGDVNAPGTYTLRGGGDRVLDILAQAGGITGETFATYVTLNRGNNSAKVAYDVVTSTPRENIFLAPGDSLNVTEEPKRYYVFGATGGVGEFEFGSEDLTLNEAVARVGGLNDGQADPSKVFVYRTEHRGALDHLGVDTTEVYEHYDAVPTIYQADYRKPDIFFLARQFQIRDGDVIYVSNADSIEIGKFFGIATTITGGPVAVDANVDTLVGN